MNRGEVIVHKAGDVFATMWQDKRKVWPYTSMNSKIVSCDDFHDKYEKDNTITEKDCIMAEKDIIIARLQAQLTALGGAPWGGSLLVTFLLFVILILPCFIAKDYCCMELFSMWKRVVLVNKKVFFVEKVLAEYFWWLAFLLHTCRDAEWAAKQQRKLEWERANKRKI